MTTCRLLRIKHDRHDLGFFSANVLTEDDSANGWALRVESPADLEEFRTHLSTGNSMDLTLVTREGDYLHGEAAVAHVSDASDEATVVTLSGLGPLTRS